MAQDLVWVEGQPPDQPEPFDTKCRTAAVVNTFERIRGGVR